MYRYQYQIIKNRVTNVISLCRPPDTSVDNFTEEIEDLLKKHNQQTYVCGDININLLKCKQHDQTPLSIKCFH